MPTPPCIIAIGGPSCSGKTSIASALAAALPEGASALVSLDSYYRDLSLLPAHERAATNFDAPESLDWPLVRQHLAELSLGHAVHVPEYDFVHHLRRQSTSTAAAKPYLILEGLFALYDRHVREVCGLCVYVDAPDDRMRQRRIERDMRERGRTPENVANQYATHVLPMAMRHVLPTRAYAGLVLDGTDTPADSARRIVERLMALKAPSPTQGRR